MSPASQTPRPATAWLSLAALTLLAMAAALWLWQPRDPALPAVAETPLRTADTDLTKVSAAIDAALEADWSSRGIHGLPPVDDLIVARRLSLALTGAIPSLEEIRLLESQPADSRLDFWLDRLLADPRSADYLAERLARASVGVEGGPFLVYRRLALVRWLSEQLQQRRPYDAIVREMITAEGLWTTNPAANFITSSIDNNNQKEGPDQIRLAIRTTRAFLGVRIDCVQCHDDKFGDRWKQQDFHQLAAFYAGAEMKMTGVRDDRHKPHEVRFRGDAEERTVLPAVPFLPHLLPDQGRPREQLAVWATHPENLPFARATANRMWAILFGRPLVEPIDDIPLDAADVPPALEVLARDFAQQGHDLHRLIATIAGTRAFRRDSRSPDPAQPATAEQEKAWAAFPLTRLRPEQVAGGVIQATQLSTIDRQSPFLIQLARFGQTTDFVKRYGDPGESEFEDPGGTIPQRLLMMNGKLVRERADKNPLFGAVSRIRALAPDPAAAVEVAYLCLFTRRPTETERSHFAGRLTEAARPEARQRVLEDLYWSLLNSTEFSWNH